MIQGKGLLLFLTRSMISVPQLCVCFITAATKEATASKTINIYQQALSLSLSRRASLRRVPGKFTYPIMIQQDTNWASFYINDAITSAEAHSHDPSGEPLVQVAQSSR